MARTRPLIIGVLGGIASGKSTLSDAMARCGAVVLDADQYARDALAEPELTELLIARHGDAVLSPSTT